MVPAAGQAQLEGHPVLRPDHPDDLHRRRDRRHGAPGGAHPQAPVGLPVARVVHLDRSQEDRHHVHGAGRGHARARLRRRRHDAHAPGARLARLRGLPQRPSLRSGVHGARRDHDLLRGDAARHRAHELRDAPADRRPRRRLPLSQQFQLLDDGLGSRPGHGLAVRRRVLHDRLAGLPAVVGARSESDRGDGLLPLGAEPRRYRHDPLGHQPRGHDRQDALPGDELDAHADLRLDDLLHQHPDRGDLPRADGDARAADRGPLHRHALLHARHGRQSDDVREPDLDLGAPGGLHPHPAAVRRVLGGRLDVLRQALVRLHLHGVRDPGDHAPLLHRVAPPLLHDGRRGERQLLLRHHDDDHLDTDGGRRSSTGSSRCTRAGSATSCR